MPDPLARPIIQWTPNFHPATHRAMLAEEGKAHFAHQEQLMQRIR